MPRCFQGRTPDGSTRAGPASSWSRGRFPVSTSQSRGRSPTSRSAPPRSWRRDRTATTPVGPATSSRSRRTFGHGGESRSARGSSSTSPSAIPRRPCWAGAARIRSSSRRRRITASPIRRARRRRRAAPRRRRRSSACPRWRPLGPKTSPPRRRIRSAGSSSTSSGTAASRASSSTPRPGAAMRRS
jgi:hypothetical protein